MSEKELASAKSANPKLLSIFLFLILPSKSSEFMGKYGTKQMNSLVKTTL